MLATSKDWLTKRSWLLANGPIYACGGYAALPAANQGLFVDQGRSPYTPSGVLGMVVFAVCKLVAARFLKRFYEGTKTLLSFFVLSNVCVRRAGCLRTL
jgi:hypothetical protein